MMPTRIPTIAVTAALCAVAWMALLTLFYGDLPALPWSAVPTLLAVAVAEAYTGLLLRPRILGRPGTKPVDAISVARTAALGKASAYAAAVVGGIAGGFLIHIAGSLDKPIPRHDALVAAWTLGSAVAMAAGALYLEYCCRVPGHPARRTGGRDRGGDGGADGDWDGDGT